MTESPFPFEPQAEEPAAGGGDRRKMVLLAGVGALAVAVLGYFVVVPAFAGGGSDTTTTMVRKAPSKSKAKSKTAAKKPAAKKPAAQPASYEDVSGRKNPFRELWVKPEAAPVASAGTAPGTAPVSGTDGTTTPSSSGTSTSVGGQRVALMTVYAKDSVQFAQTRVGDVVYTPRVGQVFAVSFKLLAVSGKTATYLYGDEQFTLSVGQEVLK
jgi:hypothetical protein